MMARMKFDGAAPSPLVEGLRSTFAASAIGRESRTDDWWMPIFGGRFQRGSTRKVPFQEGFKRCNGGV